MNSDKRCPDCGSSQSNYNETQAEIVCTVCGLVLEESIIEDKVYIPESKKKLSEHPVLSRAGGQQINGRIVKISWLNRTREKNFEHAMKKIDLIASRLNLPEKIIKETKIIFKKGVDANLNHGRDNLSLIMGSIYASCLIYELPKTPSEITAHSEITVRRLLLTYKALKATLGLKNQTINPLDLLPRFASKLGLKPDTITTASKIIVGAMETGSFRGKTPQTITATAIYLAIKQTGERKTQREIANVAGVTEGTFRVRSREFREI